MISRASSLTTFAVVVSALASSPGCKKVMDKLEKTAKEEAAKAAEEAAAPPSEVSDSDKTNAYIECSNRFVSRAYQAKERYLSWADAKKGPTGKEKIVYGTYTLVGNVATECRAKIDRVKAARPSMPELEAAGEQLVIALEGLAPVLEDANSYYSTQGHKVDAMKQGKELHPKLMAAFAAFEQADDAISIQLGAIEDKHLEQQLAELADDEDRVPYLMTKVLATGKKLVGITSKADDIAGVELAAFEPALTAYATAVGELDSYTKAHKEVSSEIVSFSRSEARGILTQSNALLHRLRDKVKLSGGDKMMIEAGNPQMVEGHPAAVVAAYNDMIEASNRL